MPKIRKRTSKRVGFREKYRVKKKVLEHHRKLRKTAKKLSAAGMKPKPTKRKMETLLPAAVLNLETLADVKKRAKLEESTDGDGSIDNEGDVKM